MRNTLHNSLWIVALLALLVVALPVLAQADGTLSYGDTVSGTISEEQLEARYTFEGHAGETILVSMNRIGEGLDPFLYLLLPNGSVILSDDDSGGNLNALIGPYRLPEDGVYTIVATRFMRESSTGAGEYRLTLQLAEVIPFSQGQPVTVTLDDSQPMAFFAYEGSVGEMLNLIGQGLDGDVDYNINVRNPDGLNVNGLYGRPNQIATIDPLVLERSGTYTFAMARQNSSGTMDVQGTSVQVTLTLHSLEPEQIIFDAPITGHLDDSNPSDHYVFEGHRGDQFRLEGSQTPGSAPYDVQIITPEGYNSWGGSAAYAGEGSDQFVMEPVLEADAQYLLVVRRIDVTGEGIQGQTDYTLVVNLSPAPMLQSGQAVTGSLEQSATYQERAYRFEGAEGMTVRITLRSENDSYAPSMDVQQPAQDVDRALGVGGGYGGGGGYGVLLLGMNTISPGTVTYETTLPATGVYLFRVRNGLYLGMPMPTDSSLQAETPSQFSLMVEVLQ